MFFGRWTNQQSAPRSLSALRRILPTGLLVATGLLSGCGQADSLSVKGSDNYRRSATASRQPVIVPTESHPHGILVASNEIASIESSQAQLSSVRLASDSYSIDSIDDSDSLRRLPRVEDELASDLWEFPVYGSDGSAQASTALSPLPAVDEPPAVSKSKAAELDTEGVFVAQLLPPRQLSSRHQRQSKELRPSTSSASSSHELAEVVANEPTTLPVLSALTKQEQLLRELLRDSSSAATGVLTDRRVNEIAKSKIQGAYAMASRGSLYVAQQELVEVIRMISQAKDAQQGSRDRTEALAEGLRALREAEDFAPQGTQLEAELDIKVLCASHRTPLAKQSNTENVLPRVMMDRYLRYAQLQLAMSVAGEPAGSMALHALGKLSSQLGRVEPDKHRLADRRAIAYQQAALLAHNQNHLAAHELGVLLAKSGHLDEAQQLLSQVATLEPNAIVFRNLARVQEQLGQQSQALANRDHAQQLSQQGATGTNNVQWVSPTQFVQASAQPARFSTAQRPVTNQVPLPGSRRAVQPTMQR